MATRSPSRVRTFLTASVCAGAQGTLGELVEIADRIPEILNAALERMRLCSNDRALVAWRCVACHACLLVPETSCEARNVYRTARSSSRRQHR
jgi:hypothetical protein